MDDNLIKAVASGNVMLFLGAGFSQGSSSITGKNLPLASALANEVASLRGFCNDPVKICSGLYNGENRP